MPAGSMSAVWVDILPSMRSFGVELARQAAGAGTRTGQAVGNELERAARRAGRDAGDALAAGVESAEARVKAAGEAVSAARSKEADAAGKVRVAEAKLTEVRAKSTATGSQIAAAEERLAAANRTLVAAQRVTITTTGDLEQAQTVATTASRRMADEHERNDSILNRLAQSMNHVDTSKFDTGAKHAASFAASSYKAASAVAAIGTAIPAVAGIAAITAQASGAALILPGAFLAGGVAAGVLKLGLNGIGEAVKNWDDPKKFAEAIKDLSYEGQAAAIAIRDLRPELVGLRNEVQNSLLAGASDDINALAKTYLPVLRNGLTEVGDEFAVTRGQLVQFATSAQTVGDVGAIIGYAETATHDLGGAVVPLASAFRDVGVVGGEVFSGLTHGADSAAQRFADFIAEARGSGQLAGWMYQALQVLDDLGELAGNVGNILGSVFAAAQAGGGGLLDTMIQVTGAVAAMLSSAEGQAALTTLFTTIHQVVTNLLPGLHAVGDALFTAIVAVGPAIPGVATAFSAVAIALTPLLADLTDLVVTVLPPLVSIITELAPLLPAIVVGFVAARTALAGFNIISGIVQWYKTWAAAQYALNVAMSANPVGLIIAAIVALVAAFVWLWNNNEGFRNFWIGLWESIKAIAVSVWTGFLKPVIDGIVAGFNWLVDGAVWLWSVLEPVFAGIGLAARIVAAVLLTVLITPILLAFKLFAAAAMFLWETGIKPAFDLIAFAAQLLWDYWLKPNIDLAILAFGLLASAAMFLWENGIKPAFDAIGALISWVWTTFFAPFIDSVVQGLALAGQAASLLWHEHIVPALEGIGSAFQWLWDHSIGVVIELVKTGLAQGGEAVGKLGSSFSDAVDFIGKVWDKLKGIAAIPVNFIIETVYNNGIRKVWNWVAGFVGLDELAPIDPIKFAGGGVLGGYAPGRDIVPALLSPGESVLTPEATKLLGPNNIMALNASVSGRRGTVTGRSRGVHRFAGGGVVGDLLGWIPGIGDDIVAMWTDPAKFIGDRLGGGSGFIRGLAAMPAELLSKGAEWLWGKLKDFVGFGEGGAISGDLAKWITAAINLTGVGMDWFGPLNTLIMRESGGNPNAINLWDSNAQAGYPSQGLMQTIPQTFAAYRDPRLPNVITDPIANIVAGIRYILARYGSIFNVQQAVGSTPLGYDSGGYLMPGVSMVYNGTGRPEPVLTTAQWNSLEGNGNNANEPVLITGTLAVADDGLNVLVTGHINSASHATGTAVLNRRR